jgi:hypothetical protein
MNVKSLAASAGCIVLLLSGCGGGFGSNPFGGESAPTASEYDRRAASEAQAEALEQTTKGDADDFDDTDSTIWDLFSNAKDPNITVEVNRYLWQASLEVLNFLPIETVDPFTGVIVTGYGTPPGGGRAYRATIYVSDPALDARSLRVSLQGKGGAVSTETQRAVEDAILTRARALRVRDSRL